jgi:hypothetical protein
MKYLIKCSYLIASISLLFSLESCVKNRNDLATDFGSIQPIVEIRDNISGLGNDAGLSNFGKASLSFPATDDADTASFYVNLASVNVMGKDINVTVAVDQAAIDAYNSDPANTVDFVPMPDSLFSIPQTQVTIPAGLRVALVQVIFHPSKFDASKSYMLPISITDASGLAISGNFGTIYYHSIGNPSAGVYDYVEASPPIRYSYVGVVTYQYPGPYPEPGGGTVDLRPYYPKIASPTDPTTISISYANGFANMLITQDPTTHAITNITLDDAGLASVSNFFVYFSSYDDATKTFHIISHYNNVNTPPNSGNDRIIDETFTKQ